MRQGTTSVEIERILQLVPIGPQHSALVFTLGGIHTQIQLKPYLEVATKLAEAIAASGAPGPLAPLGEIRYGQLVAAAHAGELDVAQSPADSGASVSAPADVVGSLRAALGPLLDKRVLLAPIEDNALANILKKVAKGENGESVVGFLDTGMRASGKAGWAFTTDTLHISGIGDHQSISDVDIRSFARKKNKVVIDSRLAGEITCDVFSVEDAAIPALEAVTGLTATT